MSLERYLEANLRSLQPPDARKRSILAKSTLGENVSGPPFEVTWFRHYPKSKYDFDNLTFTAPRRFFLAGDIDAGKSVFLELVGAQYKKNGARIFDAWSSLDNEGLAQLRAPYAANAKILILHGPSVELQFDKKHYDTRIAGNITDADLRDYELIVTSPRFYPLIDWSERYEQMAMVIRRLLTFRDHYRPEDIIFAIFREASEILYSRLKSWENIEMVKAQIVQLLNTCRHAGIAFGYDVQRPLNLDKAVREASDFKVFKRLDYNGLPDEIGKWAYRWVDPEELRQLREDQFLLIGKDGSIGVGRNAYVPWHKREYEDLLSEFGIRIIYKETPIASELRGGVMSIGDFDHAEILRYYIVEGLGMSTIKNIFDKKYIELGLKTRISTETISRHIDWHDKDIEAGGGACARCRRAGSPLLHTLSLKGSERPDAEE